MGLADRAKSGSIYVIVGELGIAYLLVRRRASVHNPHTSRRTTSDWAPRLSTSDLAPWAKCS